MENQSKPNAGTQDGEGQARLTIADADAIQADRYQYRPEQELPDKKNGMTKFETWTVFFGAVGLVIGAVTLYGLHVQIADTEKQIGDASDDALIARRHTREQLRILQEQTAASQKQVEAVARQMRQDQRPWMQVDLSTPKIESDHPIESTLTITNTGKTPAQQVGFAGYIEVIRNGSRPVLNFKKDACGTIGTAGSAIFTGQPQQLQIVSCKTIKPGQPIGEVTKLSADQWAQFMAGNIFVVAYARVEYSDGFGIHHWTNACKWSYYTQTPTKFFTAANCTKFNAVDQNK